MLTPTTCLFAFVFSEFVCKQKTNKGFCGMQTF